MRDRLASLLRQRGYGAQADLARALGEHRNRVNNWVRGYADIPVDDVPRIAKALDVTICQLYGLKESHGDKPATNPATGLRGRRQSEVVARMLAEALDRNPERIEVHVYESPPGQPPVGDWKVGESVQSEGFTPDSGDRATRRVLERWSSMTDEQRDQLLAYADAIRGGRT